MTNTFRARLYCGSGGLQGRGQRGGAKVRPEAGRRWLWLSLAAQAESGPYLHPTGGQPRLGRRSTLWVWLGVFLFGASSVRSGMSTNAICKPMGSLAQIYEDMQPMGSLASSRRWQSLAPTCADLRRKCRLGACSSATMLRALTTSDFMVEGWGWVRSQWSHPDVPSVSR